MKKIVRSLLFFIFIFMSIFKILDFSVISKDNRDENIQIEVRGDVKQEKVLNLKLGSTFSDALKQIELTDTSDISSISLNMPLSNNMVINIRSISKNILISINNSTIEELCSIPGIGEKTAIKIIEYRNINGSFHNIEEIQNVSGIGEKKFEKIKEYITL